MLSHCGILIAGSDIHKSRHYVSFCYGILLSGFRMNGTISLCRPSRAVVWSNVKITCRNEVQSFSHNPILRTGSSHCWTDARGAIAILVPSSSSRYGDCAAWVSSNESASALAIWYTAVLSDVRIPFSQTFMARGVQIIQTAGCGMVFAKMRPFAPNGYVFMPH